MGSTGAPMQQGSTLASLSAVVLAGTLLLGTAPLVAAQTGGLSTQAPTLVFLTDFGIRDDAIAICKGVMLGIAPDLRIVDLTHDVTAFDVREGAFYLAQTAPYFPVGTVFVGVVDPGVGTARGAIVVETERGQLFVGPDNGLLSIVAAEQGVSGIWEVVNPEFMLPFPSATFHGRDVFSPCGAWLAAGREPHEVGPALPAIVSLQIEPARRDGDRLLGEVMLLDKSFGNVWTNIGRDLVTGLSSEPRPRLEVRFETRRDLADPLPTLPPVMVPLVDTFGDVPVGSELAYFNSRDQLSLAVNMGSFAGEHGIEAGTRLEVRVVSP